MSNIQAHAQARDTVAAQHAIVPMQVEGEQLLYYVTPGLTSSQRLWVWGMETLSPRTALELDHLQEVLNKVCCWSGPDKVEHNENYKCTMLSWELPGDSAQSIITVVELFLKRLSFGGVKVENGYRF
jgi:hypothetical protein